MTGAHARRWVVVAAVAAARFSVAGALACSGGRIGAPRARVLLGARGSAGGESPAGESPAGESPAGESPAARPGRSVALRRNPRWVRYAKRRLRGYDGRPLYSSLYTGARVVGPALVAAFLGVEYYDNLSSYINANWLDSSSIRFLSSDEIQFIPSFLTVLSLLFSILAGNAYQSLYNQQESIYFALYAEVSEAKSLLEQMALVCNGRPFYRDALAMMRTYVEDDLRRLDVPPADLMARTPSADPLESIMYLTSVGVPSVIYETVRDLRQARGYRLGAMQRKFPRLGVVLLYILALLELAAFPLLGAGTAVGAPASIFNVQGALFGGLCGATTLVLRIIQELWRTSGGAFNVDAVLTKMVAGLSEELELRAANAVAFERSLDTGRSLDSRLDRGGPRPPPRASDARDDDDDDDDATARWRFWRRQKPGARDLT